MATKRKKVATPKKKSSVKPKETAVAVTSFNDGLSGGGVRAKQKAATEKALSTLIVPSAARVGYVKRIKAAMNVSNKGAAEMVRGVVQTGKELNIAKEGLDHGEWLPMLKEDLQMGEDKAEMLMKIARNSVLSNSDHDRNLPPSYNTLALLARVPVPRLEAKIEDGTINPGMERKDVKPLLPANQSKKKKHKTDDDPEEETTAGSMSAEDQWQQAIANAASEILSLDAFYTQTFGEEWREYRVSSDVVTLVKQATAAWNKLASHIERG